MYSNPILILSENIYLADRWDTYIYYLYSAVGQSNTIHRLHLCREVRPPYECPGYDIKSSDGEAQVLEIWGMWSNLPFLLLRGPLCPGDLVPFRILSM